MEEIIHDEATISLLIKLLIFFGISGILVPMLQRFSLSPILSYLICGLLISPFSLSYISEWLGGVDYIIFTDKNLVKGLAELGVISLMFMIGLKISVKRLFELKKYVLGLGTAQILVTGSIIALIASYFTKNIEAAIIIGAALSLSSTAIVMQVLDEQHSINKPSGILSFSVLLMQDLAVIPIIVLIRALGCGGEAGVLTIILKALLVAGVTVIIIFILGRLILRPIFSFFGTAKNPEWLAALVLFIVVGSSYITQEVGLSAAFGAFLAGILIAETEFKHEVEIIIEPIKSILMGIFFLSIGMMIDVNHIMHHPLLLIGSVLVIFLIKSVTFFPLPLIFKVHKAQAAETSVMLAQCGEFAFLIFTMAMNLNILTFNEAQYCLLVTALSMFLSPILMKLSPSASRLAVYNPYKSETEGDKSSSGFSNAPAADDKTVLIAGFGRVGMVIAAMLEKEMIPYKAIDKSASRVTMLRNKGYNVIYGNVKRYALWRKLKIDTAKAVIITIDEYETALEILKSIRAKWPLMPIIMRARDTNSMDTFYSNDASYVVPEVFELSLQLAKNAMESIGIPKDEVEKLILKKREQAILEKDDVLDIKI